MCGISLILDFKGKAQTEHLHKMMDAIKHRGPDASHHIKKTFGDGNLFLGSNRLQIIDKDIHSNQPLISQDGRYALVFNGEIYNSEELRNELLTKGFRFTTRSDTEVLLQWLINKGKEGIKHLNGMFAFIFTDLASATLIIARDNLGIKPLFIHQSLNMLVVSSEIEGILAMGLVKKRLNKEIIPHYLAYKYAPRPATFYKTVEEFMPGTIWQIEAGGTTKKSSFQPEVVPTNSTINDLLVDAVVQQYSEPNNTGIMLSGGVDSTLLLTILTKELGIRNVPVFSVSSKGNSRFDTQDGKYAKQAAKLYQAEYNEVGVEASALDDIDNYIATIGQPIADSGAYLTWLVGKKASSKSRVLLSGAGADEIFGGYNRHTAFNSYLKHRHKSWFGLLKKAGKLPAIMPFFNQVQKLSNSIDTDPSTTFNNFIQSDVFKETKSIWGNNLSDEEHLQKALLHDQTNYLGADVLAITDQATMQHSIETRVPYLDTQLVAAARNLSIEALFNKEPKHLLKQQLIKYGGKPFATRKKQGFGLPMNNWLKADKLWQFNEKENHIHEFVSKQRIEEIRKRHSSNKENLTQELWRILLLHKWLILNF